MILGSNSDSPVFGLTGVNHLNGLKEYLKESNAFEYFFMYSSSHSGLNGLEELEEYKISLTKDIPEGVHIFDIDEMGHDNTIEAIVNIILNHEEHSNHKKKSKERETSLPTVPILFFSNTNSQIMPIDQWQKSTDVINYLFNNKYIPSIVSDVIEAVLNDNHIEKLFFPPIFLHNFLNDIFTRDRPTINQSDRDKLKTEVFDLLLNNKTYFSKLDGTGKLFSTLKTIFPERFDEILNMCHAASANLGEEPFKQSK